ncbi:MAG: hypothetical protein AB3N14_09010 [Flavobacteriaceae bacterium]
MRTNNKTLKGKRKSIFAFRTLTITLLMVICTNCTKEGGLEDPDLIDPLVPSDNLQEPLEPSGNLQGTLEEVKDYYTVEFVDAMEDIGFEINLGNNPPNLEGSYLISPFILEVSTIEADSTAIGGQFQDYLATFSNQDNDNLTIDLSGVQADQTDDGEGSFITGANGKFTVYTKTTSSAGNSEAQTAVSISGTLSPNGILNLQFFGAMLDDHGDPENIFIENNTGRLLVDGDDFSPKQEQSSKTSKRNLDSWVWKLE